MKKLILTSKEKIVCCMLAVQLALAGSILVLRPGFDHPNSLGLDFDFVMLVAGVYLLVWIAGIIVACTLPVRRVWYVFLHVLSPLLCFGLLGMMD